MLYKRQEPVGYIWRKIYEALANVNNVIQYQPQVISELSECKGYVSTYSRRSFILEGIVPFRFM